MLQRNILGCLDLGGVSRFLGTAGVLVLLFASCSVTREIDDLTEGCPEGTKFCGLECVPLDDADFGCLPDTCEPCQVANATRLTCRSGQCAPAACDDTSKLCDDACVSRSLPEFGCGRPGCSACIAYKATGYECSAFGTCEVVACTSGWADCNQDASDGCEANLVEDKEHCGLCRVSCSALPHAEVTCGNKACVIRVCESGYKDCDKMVSNGCEIDIMTNNKHCGGCGRPCEAEQTCTEGACQ